MRYNDTIMKHEFSAGGVVFKDINDNRLILVGQHSYHHGWVFPKGLIGDHVEEENKEDTALREVQEETGVLGKIIKPLAPVSYFYTWNEEKIQKTVYYYIMEFISEDAGKKDEEMEKVEWLPIDEVENRLTYESDKKVWREAKSVISASAEIQKG